MCEEACVWGGRWQWVCEEACVGRAVVMGAGERVVGVEGVSVGGVFGEGFGDDGGRDGISVSGEWGRVRLCLE